MDWGDPCEKQGVIVYHDADEMPLAPPNPDDTGANEARRRRTYEFIVVFNQSLDLNLLTECLQSPSRGATYASRFEAIQALNIVLGKYPSARGYQIGGGQGEKRYYPLPGHNLCEQVDLTGGLQALRGYYLSTKTAVGRLILNVNVSAAAFYPPVPLLELMRMYKEAHSWESETMIKKGLENFLHGVRVETNYMRKIDAKTGEQARDASGTPQTIRKVRTINCFASAERGPNGNEIRPFAADCTQVTFMRDDNTSISVAAYFQQCYGPLRAPTESAINAGTERKPTWIPPELCTVIPGQPAGGLLQGGQTGVMLRFAARRPRENMQSLLTNGLAVLSLNNQTDLGTNFGVNIDTKMIRVEARILPTPRVHHLNASVDFKRPAQWNMQKYKFFRGTGFDKWACLAINSGGALQTTSLAEVRTFMQTFQRAANSYGMRVGPFNEHNAMVLTISEADMKDDTRVSNLLDARFNQIAKANFQHLFIILPNKTKKFRALVKYFCDIKYGINSQCVVRATIDNQHSSDQYWANVALKTNLKHGGINWHVSVQNTPLDGNTILFGLDVTHPSAGSVRNAPSVAAITATVDEYFAQWPADLWCQASKQEIVLGLKERVKERLKLWQSRNGGRLPTKAVVFRDGVSEGQFQQILDHEEKLFQEAFKEMYGNQPKPRITYMIVGKRHHTRFYPDADTGDKDGNCQPGRLLVIHAEPLSLT